MRKTYLVDKGWTSQTCDDIDDVISYVFDRSDYVDNNRDNIIDDIDENNDGFSYGHRSWSFSEVMEAMDEDTLNDIVYDYADSAVADLQDRYLSDIEQLEEVDDYVWIEELDLKVYLKEIIPEDGDEEEPEDNEFVSALMDMLT